jgi:hypothetical protein
MFNENENETQNLELHNWGYLGSGPDPGKWVL